MLEVPNNVPVLKSLLARAESSQLLRNGCVNSEHASRDELLTALGLEIKDRLLTLFRDKASEERTLIALRAAICKVFISMLEQRQSSFEMELLRGKKKRRRKNKKKPEEQDGPLMEQVEFNILDSNTLLPSLNNVPEKIVVRERCDSDGLPRREGGHLKHESSESNELLGSKVPKGQPKVTLDGLDLGEISPSLKLFL